MLWREKKTTGGKLSKETDLEYITLQNGRKKYLVATLKVWGLSGHETIIQFALDTNSQCFRGPTELRFNAKYFDWHWDRIMKLSNRNRKSGWKYMNIIQSKQNHALKNI